jgi:hypothetical protein
MKRSSRRRVFIQIEKEIHMVRTIQNRLLLLAIMVLLLLSACDAGLLTRSALESTGGNGAGLSEVQ